MIQKKICMLGAFAVGKTSLVSQFVTRGFSEKYLTTVGVKIDKKTIAVDGRNVDLILWDIEGDDNSRQLYLSYLRGVSGYLLVVDGTRKATLTAAKEIHSTVTVLLGPKVPFLVLVNKKDLETEWEIQASELEKFAGMDFPIVKTSAKTGEGVEEAFFRLATSVMQRSLDASSVTN